MFKLIENGNGLCNIQASHKWEKRGKLRSELHLLCQSGGENALWTSGKTSDGNNHTTPELEATASLVITRPM